jgi:putative transposase
MLDSGLETKPSGCSSSNRANRFRTAFIESFNSRLREECLHQHVFLSLDDTRQKIEAWRQEQSRPASQLARQSYL